MKNPSSVGILVILFILFMIALLRDGIKAILTGLVTLLSKQEHSSTPNKGEGEGE